MKFLFMDETYMARSMSGSATTLTGLLVPAETHAPVRDRLQSLLKTVEMSEPNVVNRPIAVHATDLFKDLGVSDEVKLAFLDGVVDLCLEFGFKIHRIGYYNDPGLPEPFTAEKQLLGLCFLSMLWSLGDELRDHMIWPVMERDGSVSQDDMFAGQVRSIDHYTARLNPGLVSVNNENLGELLYTTKHSGYGALVDCVAYLRHVTHLAANGVTLTPFKSELAKIAERLAPAIARDETIHLRYLDEEAELKF